MSNRFRTSVALFAALAAAGSALAFPAQVELHNNHFRLAVEPETSSEVPALQSVTVTVKDADQLKRMVCNVEQLNAVNGFEGDVGLTVVVLDLPDEQPATLEPPAPPADPPPEQPPAPPEAPVPQAPAVPQGKSKRT